MQRILVGGKMHEKASSVCKAKSAWKFWAQAYIQLFHYKLTIVHI